MTQYWNYKDFTYHVSVDEQTKKAKITKHDSDGKRVGRKVTVTLKQYEACPDRYAVDELFKSKEK